MSGNVIKSWDTDLVDVASASAATKIAKLHGGQSITIKSLASASHYHYIGMKHLAEASRGYKLQGGETMTIALPIEFGRNNEIEIWAMATNAGDDVTWFKVTDYYPQTSGSGDSDEV